VAAVVAEQKVISISGGATPAGYTLAPGEGLEAQAVTATFDGSGAGAAFLPTLSFYDPAGNLLARQYAEQQEVGQVSEVTFAPFLKRTS
jgi:hypothetical protein